MAHPLTIDIPEPVYHTLEKWATQQGTTPEALARDWVARRIIELEVGSWSPTLLERLKPDASRELAGRQSWRTQYSKETGKLVAGTAEGLIADASRQEIDGTAGGFKLRLRTKVGR